MKCPYDVTINDVIINDIIINDVIDTYLRLQQLVIIIISPEDIEQVEYQPYKQEHCY